MRVMVRVWVFWRLLKVFIGRGLPLRHAVRRAWEIA